MLINVAQSGLVYECKMLIKDGPVFETMCYYLTQYPRYGARRVRIFLRLDGAVSGIALLGSRQMLTCRRLKSLGSPIEAKIADHLWLQDPIKYGRMTLSLMTVPMAIN